jgi:hypothetical protein
LNKRILCPGPPRVKETVETLPAYTIDGEDRAFQIAEFALSALLTAAVKVAGDAFVSAFTAAAR